MDMKASLAALAMMLVLTPDLLARDRLLPHPPSLPSPRSVLWIAAHPDDEAVVAPLLAFWCREQHAQCTLLILTRGERGACLRTDGCAPDLATVRSGEAGAASQYFGADLILWSLPNGDGSTPPGWTGDVAGRMAALIEAVAPELVLTFDPRHGTTCHPDHMAVGSVVLDAVQRLSGAPPVYLLESRVTTTPVIHFAPAVLGAIRFDGDWQAILDDAQRHPSQFDAAWLAAIANVPPEERAVFVIPASAARGDVIAPCR